MEQTFKKLLEDIRKGLEAKRNDTNIEQELFLLLDVLVSLLDRLKDHYVKDTDIVDNLLSEETDKVLSANMGRVLSLKTEALTYGLLFNGGTVDGAGVCTLSEIFKLKFGIEELTLTAENAGEYNGAFFICSEEASEGVPAILETKINDWIVATEDAWGKISDSDISGITNSDIDNLN